MEPGVIFSTEKPRPAGTVEVDGVAHDVWSQYDIRYEDVEAFERVIPRLGVTPEAISSDQAADIIEFLACVIPTLTRDGLRNMRPRRLLALYLTVMPKVCTDPLALGRPSSEATSTAPSPASTTTPSEAA